MTNTSDENEDGGVMTEQDAVPATPPSINVMERRRAQKEAAQVAQAAVAQAEDLKLAGSVRAAQERPAPRAEPPMTRNERLRRARDAAAAKATEEEMRIVEHGPVKIGERGSTNTPLHVLNALADRQRRDEVDAAREIANDVAKVAMSELLRPDRKRHLRGVRARRVANAMQG